MGQSNYFKPGDWNAVCSMCGRQNKASELVKNWQGMYRCPEHNEPRHPQDFVRAVPDIQTPPWTQPEPEWEFIGFCTPDGMSDYADTATADCVIVDYVSPFYTGG